MSLVIAVVLIVALFCIARSDKAKERDFDARQKAWMTPCDDFERAYTSPVLEREIKIALSDKTKRAAICREVNAALQEMPGWSKYRCDEEKNLKYFVSGELLYESQTSSFYGNDLAVDILLANRGKVTEYAAQYGYKSYMSSDDCSGAIQNLKESAYEKIEWIQKALRKHGVELTPVHAGVGCRSRYAWLGSYAAPKRDFNGECSYKPFNRSLLEPPEYTVFKLDE